MTLNNIDKQFDDWWDEFENWGYRSERCIAALENLCISHDRKAFAYEVRHWLKAAFEAGVRAQEMSEYK